MPTCARTHACPPHTHVRTRVWMHARVCRLVLTRTLARTHMHGRLIVRQLPDYSATASPTHATAPPSTISQDGLGSSTAPLSTSAQDQPSSPSSEVRRIYVSMEARPTSAPVEDWAAGDEPVEATTDEPAAETPMVLPVRARMCARALTLYACTQV